MDFGCFAGCVVLRCCVCYVNSVVLAAFIGVV